MRSTPRRCRLASQASRTWAGLPSMRSMLPSGARIWPNLAASAARRVGYESPSQFSREYWRLFGAPPREDITLLRSAAG